MAEKRGTLMEFCAWCINNVSIINHKIYQDAALLLQFKGIAIDNLNPTRCRKSESGNATRRRKSGNAYSFKPSKSSVWMRCWIQHSSGEVLDPAALPDYQDVVDTQRNPREHQGRSSSFSRCLHFVLEHLPDFSPFFMKKNPVWIQHISAVFLGKNLALKQHFNPFFRCNFVAFRVDLRL